MAPLFKKGKDMKEGIEIIREENDIRRIKYYINEAKKTVVCVIEDSFPIAEDDDIVYFRETISRGKAKCLPEDKFDKELGMRIARDKADIAYHRMIAKSLCKDVDKATAAFKKYMANISIEIAKQNDKINHIAAHLDGLISEDIVPGPGEE